MDIFRSGPALFAQTYLTYILRFYGTLLADSNVSKGNKEFFLVPVKVSEIYSRTSVVRTRSFGP